MPPVESAAISQGALSVLSNVLLIPALFLMAKWLFGGTIKAIGAVADRVEQLVKTVGEHTTEIAVLKAQRTADAAEITKLRAEVHDQRGEMQAMAARCALRHDARS